MSLPSGRSTVVHTFYAGVARSRSGSSSFTASALNKPSSSSSSDLTHGTGIESEELGTKRPQRRRELLQLGRRTHDCQAEA